jgi:hypothetical protein
MERQNSKDFEKIAKPTNEQYYRQVSHKAQRDFLMQEACRLRYEREMKTLERLSRKIEG